MNRVKAIYRSWGIPVNGSVGIVVAPGGRLRIVISCTVKGEKITEMDVIAEPARIGKLNLRVLPDRRTNRLLELLFGSAFGMRAGVNGKTFCRKRLGRR